MRFIYRCGLCHQETAREVPDDGIVLHADLLCFGRKGNRHGWMPMTVTWRGDEKVTAEVCVPQGWK